MFQASTDLDVVALVVVATFPEQAMMDNIVDVELIKKRVAILSQPSATKQEQHVINAYLRNRSGKNYNLIELTHTLHELIHTRPFDDIDVMKCALNLDWYSEVGLMKGLTLLAFSLHHRKVTNLETTVNQSLVQIQY